MRPNVARTSDPIDEGRLPGPGGFGLDYLTRLFSEEDDRSETVYQLLRAAVMGAFLTVALRGLSYVVSAPFFLSLFVLLGFLIAVFVYLQRNQGAVPPTLRALAWLLAGPLVWIAIQLSKNAAFLTISFALLFPPVLLFSMYLSDAIATHFVSWTRASLPGAAPARDALVSAWNKRLPRAFRFLVFPLRDEEREGTARPSPELEERAKRVSSHYPKRIGTLVVAYAASFLVLGAFTLKTSMRPFAPMLTLLVFLALTVALGLYWNLRAGALRASPRLFLHALVSWTTYNRHHTRAPGVFQSPLGPQVLRMSLLTFSVVLAALVILPFASYFPVVPMAYGPLPWAHANGYDATPPPAPSHDEVLRELRPHEKVILETKLTPDGRNAYLEQLALRRQIQAARVERAVAIRELIETTTRYSETWLLLALKEAVSGHPVFIWSIFFSLVFSLLSPLLLVLAVLYLVSGQAIALADTAIASVETDAEPVRGKPPAATAGRTPWDDIVDNLRNSKETAPVDGKDVAVADHLFVGTNCESDYPVLLHRHILHEHAWLLGDSGSGKTSRGLSPILAQLIRMAACRGNDEEHFSVVIIDLKGDRALFRGAQLEAEAHGAEFKWFSLGQSRSTYVFNPFQQDYLRDVGVNEQTQIVLNALGLEFGEGYGRQHFSLVYQRILSLALESRYNGPGEIGVGSFAALRDLLRSPRSFIRGTRAQRDLEQASDLFTLVDELARIPQLNVTPEENPSLAEAGIDMLDTLLRPQVLYFWLPAAFGRSATRVATLAAYSLLLTEAVQKETGDQPGRVYFFIDEFQQMASEQFKIFLEQARDMEISVILSNQTRAQLRALQGEIESIIENSTRMKLYFAASDTLQREAISAASGEAMYETIGGETDGELDVVKRFGEMIGPRLRANDIIDSGNIPDEAIFHVPRSYGLTQFGGYPFRIRCPHHITLEEYEDRKDEDWPADLPGTLVPKTYDARRARKTPRPKNRGTDPDDIGRKLAQRARRYANPKDETEQEKTP